MPLGAFTIATPPAGTITSYDNVTFSIFVDFPKF
jgi:hypothetical protein